MYCVVLELQAKCVDLWHHLVLRKSHYWCLCKIHSVFTL